MPNTVVITRPLAQAEPLCQAAAALGHRAVAFPLLEILPLEDASALDNALARLADFDLVAFVSPNAIGVVCGKLKTWPSGTAIAVMGEGSRKALASHGITDSNASILRPRDPRRSDSSALLEQIDLPAMRGKRVAIFRGDGGRELLADALRAHGAEVEQIAVYRRRVPELTAERGTQLRSLIAEQADWIVTSSEAMRGLLKLAHEAAGDSATARLKQQRLIVPHARIRQTALELGCVNIILTGSGDEALLAAL